MADDDRFEVTLVVTQPDRPAGRGRSLTSPPIANAARDLGLDIFQPVTLRHDNAVERIDGLNPDLLIVVAYGELLSRSVLELAPHGALNVHPSLLPRYRGASPIPAAILSGDNETGTSIIKLVRRLDAGPIVAQARMDIMPDDTTLTLRDRLSGQAASMLPNVCDEWIAGRIVPIDQADVDATYTREWTRDDAHIDWDESAQHIERLVRAANPWPIAWTDLDGSLLRIVRARPGTPHAGSDRPGHASVDAGRVLVATGDGALELLEVQPAGKRPMAALDWLRGVRRPHIVFAG
jgi:methionyl-tRNA formyltransferase